jgi:hypothetical protein
VYWLCDAKATNDPERINWDRLRQYLNTTQSQDIVLQENPKNTFADRECKAGSEKALTWLDDDGITPCRCALDSEWPVSKELFRLLFTPQVATIADSRNGSTPLHLICQKWKSHIRRSCLNCERSLRPYRRRRSWSHSAALDS